MRNKILTLLAHVLCMSAFFLPATAYAQADSTPPTLTAKITGDMLKVEAKDASGIEAIYINEHRFSTLVNGTANVKHKDYAGNSAQIAVYATDTAGNRSQPVMIDNPYYQAPSPTPTPTPVPTPAITSTPAPTTPEPTAALPEPQPTATEGGDTIPGTTESGIPNGANAFTPDGTGTVMDNVAEQNGKEFFTITTENENTFYLIIDRQRDSENVYLLNAVTESDLMALAEKDKSGSSQSAIPTPTPEVRPTPEPTPTPEPATPDKPVQGGVGTIIFIIIAVLAAGGAGYYFKIYKPRKDASQADEDEEYEDEGEESPEGEYIFDSETDKYPPDEPDAEDN